MVRDVPGPPMLCDRCGFRFPMDYGRRSPIQGDSFVTLRNTAMTCPNCGGMARQVRSGSYQLLLDGTMREIASALAQPGATKSDLITLREILEESQRASASAERVAAEIAARTPFKRLGETLSSTNGVAIATWIGAVAAVVAILIALRPQEPPVVNVQVDAPEVHVQVVADQPSEEQIRQWVKEAATEAVRKEREAAAQEDGKASTSKPKTR